MKFNRQSLITLGLVAVVGVGLIGAYASNACDNEKTAQQASAGKACTAEQMAACQAKGVSADKAGCCAKKTGAAQASVITETGAAIVPVGSGSSCSHGAATKASAGTACPYAAGMKKAGAGCSFEGAADCGSCKLYQSYWTSLENANRDIATLPNGIIVHYSSSDPAVVAELQKFAGEKAVLMKAVASKKFDGTLCELCAERAASLKGATFQVTNSANGVFTLITSKVSRTVDNLHKIAEAEVASTAAAKVEG